MSPLYRKEAINGHLCLLSLKHRVNLCDCTVGFSGIYLLSFQLWISSGIQFKRATMEACKQPVSGTVNKQACRIDTCQDIISSDVLVMVKDETGGKLFANSHFTLPMWNQPGARSAGSSQAQWPGSLHNTKLSFPRLNYSLGKHN